MKLQSEMSNSVNIMQGNTLTLLFPLPILLSWKKVRESLFPCMERSKLLDTMEGNTLSLTFFQKKEEGYKEKKGWWVCCLALVAD